MNYSLKQAESDFHELIQTTEKELIPLNLQQLNYKSSPTSWSMLECLQHLNLYCNYYNNQLKKASNKTSKNYNKDLKVSWVGKKSLDSISVSNTKKMKTFKRMDPSSSNLPASTLTTFINNNKELLNILNVSQGLNINKKLIPLEFFKLIKLSIGEILIFMAEHEKRHMQQALRVKASI